MRGYHDDIEAQATENSDFRRVLYTGHNEDVVQATREEADARHQAEEWDGRTTE